MDKLPTRSSVGSLVRREDRTYVLNEWTTVASRIVRIQGGRLLTPTNDLFPAEQWDYDKAGWGWFWFDGRRLSPMSNAVRDDVERLMPLGPEDHDLHFTMSAGWPFKSAWMDVRREPGVERADGGVILPELWGQKGPMALPLRPVWGALAVDLAFYALTAFALARAPVTARSWWRGRQGRCRRCGYDLANIHDAGCPECGWNRA